MPLYALFYCATPYKVSFSPWNVSETQQLSTLCHCYSKLTSSHFILFSITISFSLSLSFTHTHGWGIEKERKEIGMNTDSDYFWLWQNFYADDISVYHFFQTRWKRVTEREQGMP